MIYEKSSGFKVFSVLNGDEEFIPNFQKQAMTEV